MKNCLKLTAILLLLSVLFIGCATAPARVSDIEPQIGPVTVPEKSQIHEIGIPSL